MTIKKAIICLVLGAIIVFTIWLVHDYFDTAKQIYGGELVFEESVQQTRLC